MTFFLVSGRYASLGIVCFVLILLQWPAFAQTGQTDAEPYRLRPGDSISVHVFEDPELNAQTLILPDGRVSLPLTGTLRAAGQTPRQLEQIVRARLRSIFVDPPTVTVGVLSLAEVEEDEEEDTMFEIFVLGEVGEPGRYEYLEEQPITILKALSLAGGLGPFAARKRIQIREMNEGTETLRVFDYDAVEEGVLNTPPDLSLLSDGAIIVVPERGLFE